MEHLYYLHFNMKRYLNSGKLLLFFKQPGFFLKLAPQGFISFNFMMIT